MWQVPSRYTQLEEKNIGKREEMKGIIMRKKREIKRAK